MYLCSYNHILSSFCFYQSRFPCTIEVVGSYLYYTPGSQRLQALTTAGCTGVIVRTKMSGLGQTAVMNLVSVDTKTPDASLFKLPGYYFVIDRSGYIPPNLGGKP